MAKTAIVSEVCPSRSAIASVSESIVTGPEFFRQFARVHLIGIGGAGMEGLARILLQLGCGVSGSDREDSPVLDGLRLDGVVAHSGHAAVNVDGADLVIYSAAIPPDNTERVQAQRWQTECMGRAQAVGCLVQGSDAIAVAGTHGKTTSASMLAAVLSEAGAEPSVLIGGAIEGRIQAHLGSGTVFVCEADEFDRSFLHIKPEVALVNNIEPEHLDTYESVDELHAAFGQFIASTRRCAVVNGDDPAVERIVSSTQFKVPALSFGRGSHNDYWADAIDLRADGSSFVLRRQQESLGTLFLNIPGLHNVLNATGVAATADSVHTPFEAIRLGLSRFISVDRRLQTKGEVGGVLVIDDYAHHPTEIRAALESVGRLGRRIVTVFQPHLYSRTRGFYREFASALSASDVVLLASVYGSRESPSDGGDSDLIETSMRESGFDAVEFVPQRDALLTRMSQVSHSGDLVITMGAGDIGLLAEAFIEQGAAT